MPDNKTEPGAAVEDNPADSQDEEANVSKNGAQKEHSKDRADGPRPEHPRFNEVYGKMKSYERKLQERESDIDAIREHNKALESRLNSIEVSKADKAAEPEPDPEIDPAGYKKWAEFQRARQKQDFDKQRAIDRHTAQVDVQKELHEDYVDMAKIAERDMAKDTELNKRIWGSENPASEAYKYGLKKSKEAEEVSKETYRRDKAKEQMETEDTGDASGDTEEDEEGSDRLSGAEERVVRNLFPELKYEDAKKKYIKQKKAMGV